MADTDTGWFAVPSAKSRQFGHSGKILSIMCCFSDLTSFLDSCEGLNIFWLLNESVWWFYSVAGGGPCQSAWQRVYRLLCQSRSLAFLHGHISWNEVMITVEEYSRCGVIFMTCSLLFQLNFHHAFRTLLWMVILWNLFVKLHSKPMSSVFKTRLKECSVVIVTWDARVVWIVPSLSDMGVNEVNESLFESLLQRTEIRLNFTLM